MNSLLIELIQIALGNRDILSRLPSQKEWEAILEVAEEQAIVGVTTQGLDKLPQDQLPPKDLLLQWIGLAQLSIGTYLQHCNRARELTSKFEMAGFRSCVLKGVGLAQLYPQPDSRQFGDIDLWVEGDRKDVMAWMNKLGVVGHVIWHHVDADFFEDVPTEIHIHPCWLYNPFCNGKLQRWFDEQMDAQMTVDKELGFAYSSVQFNAVYSLVHLYHHLIEEGIGIRHIIDYYYVIKALPFEERLSVVKELKRFGMLPLAKAMMWVLQDVCGMPAEYLICGSNEREGRFLLDEVIRGGNFGHYRNDTRKRNSMTRYMALLPHYPREILWIVPWKIWHRSWMVFHKNG